MTTSAYHEEHHACLLTEPLPKTTSDYYPKIACTELPEHFLQKPADLDLHRFQEKPADQDPYCLQVLIRPGVIVISNCNYL